MAAALKGFLLWLDVVPFNADEAVVALMARHILQGTRPLFFYGQAYLGSTDAWLIAGLFLLFGQNVFLVRVVQTLLYLGTIFTTYLLARRIFDKWAATIAALLLAVPVVVLTLYTTATLGGYGETLLIGNILLLWTLRLVERPLPTHQRQIEALLFGLLAGFGFWTFGLLGVYLVPMGILLVTQKNTAGRWTILAQPLIYVFMLVGFVVGSSPWWVATLKGAATLNELGGSAIAGAGSNFWADLALHTFSLLVLGITVIIGFRPPWGVRWLGLPLAPLPLLLFFVTLVWVIRESRTRSALRLLLGVVVTLVIAFVATPFGNDPSGRYFLPALPLVAIFTGGWLSQIRGRYRWAAMGLSGGLLLFNVWGTVESILAFPPGFTTQFDTVAQVNQRDLPAVISFLKSQGETHGYGNYWVVFPMAFLSNEELIYSAELPYHEDFRYTPRDNRYEPYIETVAGSERVAYVTTRHPALDDRLRQNFGALGVTFEEKVIGDFHIFYHLARKVTPSEAGVYETQ
jgi:4-amino-4-deoxy-L-arabinose transferase-like glycosyltransferase